MMHEKHMTGHPKGMPGPKKMKKQIGGSHKEKSSKSPKR